MLKFIAPRLHPLANSKRSVWSFLNVVFNHIDYERRKHFGPDRVCAEWLLRNGASLKWAHDDLLLNDYKSLPLEGRKCLVKEIHANCSTIMSCGFSHFEGCKHVEKIILDNCRYIDDMALQQLSFVKDTLKYLQVSNCENVTEKGLKTLDTLSNLKQLNIFNLPYVENIEETYLYLKTKLPNCDIEWDSVPKDIVVRQQEVNKPKENTVTKQNKTS